MEQRFRHDFSRVRVHTGEAAEQSARDVNANAYTVGHNIVFGGGRFAPETNEGRRLIAHELTHVVQQSGLERAAAGLIEQAPAVRADAVIQRSVRDPDELAAMARKMRRSRRGPSGRWNLASRISRCTRSCGG
jgi:uncharacterized protein DUF4157